MVSSTRGQADGWREGVGSRSLFQRPLLVGLKDRVGSRSLGQDEGSLVGDLGGLRAPQRGQGSV